MPWLTACCAVALVLGLQAIRPVGNMWPRVAASTWLLAGALSSAIGLVQYFGLSAQLTPWVNATPLGEAFGNLRQRNQYASLTNIAFAALLWWMVQAKPVAGAAWLRGAQLGLAVLLAAGNAVSSSRTGMFQMVVLLALVLMWGGWRRADLRRTALAYVLAYVAALMLLPVLIGLDPWSSGAWARLQAGDAVCSSRLTLWHNVLTLIAQHPWGGWGWGGLNYAHYITLFDAPRFCDILDNAHNLPLHLAVELGIPAALLACGLLLYWVLRSKPWAETDATRQLAWSVLAVIGLHSLLEYPLWYGPFQTAAGLCVLLLWRGPSLFERNRALAQVICALLATVLIAICSYVAWDYHRISQIYLSPDDRDPAYRMDTLDKLHASWMFHDQVEFAELSITPLTLANAPEQYRMALEMLHFSPERRVIERVIDAALLLGRDRDAVFHLARYQAAFPEGYAEWVVTHRAPSPL
ncbi:MAG: Wzy polymerase domain-containing protein [Burkholderiales bacterium]|nr:Wzy polymerase domain-containing protein [Burkholderiales bacterium]